MTFITVGDCELEFLQNFDPRQGGRVEAREAGATRPDQGAITRFVASRGPGLGAVPKQEPEPQPALSENGVYVIYALRGRGAVWTPAAVKAATK